MSLSINIKGDKAVILRLEALKRGDNDLSNKLSNSASNNLTRHQTSNEYDAGLVADAYSQRGWHGRDYRTGL